MDDLMQKLMQARSSLILDEPFFGALALRLKPLPDPSCETFWTDGKSLGFNPDYLRGLTVEEVQGVICHEVLHNACGHAWRRGGRDSQKWNQACDYAVNPIVVDGRMLLPKGILLDPGFRGMAAEKIYSLLPDAPPQGEDKDRGEGEGSTGSQRQTGSPPGCGEVRDAPGEDGEALEAEWEVATLQAAQAAQSRGKLPGGLGQIIEEIRRPKVDWKAVLLRFAQQNTRDDYSWRYPDPRYVGGGLYLPSLRSESLATICVAIDTSGSINQSDLDEFAAEVQAVMDETAPESVVVIYCDASVQCVEEYHRGDSIQLHPKGGGGTDFRPVFDHIEKEGLSIACLIYLTDLAGRFPEKAPEYPVLWAATSDRPVPFGEVVAVKET